MLFSVETSPLVIALLSLLGAASTPLAMSNTPAQIRKQVRFKPTLPRKNFYSQKFVSQTLCQFNFVRIRHVLKGGIAANGVERRRIQFLRSHIVLSSILLEFLPERGNTAFVVQRLDEFGLRHGATVRFDLQAVLAGIKFDIVFFVRQMLYDFVATVKDGACQQNAANTSADVAAAANPPTASTATAAAGTRTGIIKILLSVKEARHFFLNSGILRTKSDNMSQTLALVKKFLCRNQLRFLNRGILRTKSDSVPNS